MNKLIHGDSLSPEVLNQIQDKSIDIVFTSPPYNLGKSNYFGKWYNLNTTNTGAKYKGNPEVDNKDNYAQWLVEFVIKWLKKAEYVFLNLQSLSSNKKDIHTMLYLLNDYYCDKLIWNKEMGIPHGKNSKVMTATFEEIFIFSKKGNKRVGTKEWFGNVNNHFTMKGNRHNPDAKLHSALFPIELPTYIFKTFVKEGGVVADPFMGLGTSGRAANNLGLDYVGVELDKEYFDISIERIGKEINNG